MTGKTMRWPFVLVETNRILCHEEYIPERLDEVREIILSTGQWKTPLLVEWDDLILMDGHHRLAFARQRGLSHVPCLMADYRMVKVRSRRPQFTVTPEDIRNRARTGRLYPPKTTYHQIPQEWAMECRFDLTELGLAGGPENVVELALSKGEAS